MDVQKRNVASAAQRVHNTIENERVMAPSVALAGPVSGHTEGSARTTIAFEKMGVVG